MKIFHRDKYEYVGLSEYNQVIYYAFKCIKSNFSPEIILVDEAKMIYEDMGYVYFEKYDLPTMYEFHELSCVNPKGNTGKNLAVNESKWRKRRPRSSVNRYFTKPLCKPLE